MHRTIWLIRHGESAANAGQATHDPASIALTAHGYAQAQQVAACFDTPPDLIIASPYLRAQQTAQPTRARFPLARYEVWPVQEFTYLSPVLYKNTTVMERRPMADVYWQRADPYEVQGEGAESFAEFIARVDDALARLRVCEVCEAHDANFVAVFGHGQFIQAARWRVHARGAVTPEAMRAYKALDTAAPVPNAGIVELLVDAS